MASAVDALKSPLKGRISSRDKPTLSLPPVEVKGLVLQSRKTKVDIMAAVVGGEIERTIEGASTLTLECHDPDQTLLNGKLLTVKEPVDIKFDRFWFRLVRVSKSGTNLTLTFEDREVSLMRLTTKPRRAYRSKITRAEFILSMVRETVDDRGKKVKVPYYIPKLHVRQPIGEARQAADPKAKDRKAPDKDSSKPSVDRGLSANDNVKMKGVRASAAQMRQAERALNVATGLNAPEIAILAMLCAGIGESVFRPVVNSLGYGGVFQGQVNTGGRYFKVDDTEEMAKYFMQGGKGFQAGGAIKLAKEGVDAGTIATRVEASGKPGSFYGVYLNEAKAILKAYGGADAGGSAPAAADRTVTVTKAYAFSRGTAKKRESSWAAAQRLAEEVQWRAFMNEGKFYYVSETDLYAAKSKFTLSESSDGVSTIDFDYDRNIAVSEATINCRADMWIADPGTVVTLEKLGRANGKWLVSSMRRGVFDRETTITLKQPMKEKNEPAPETETKTIPGEPGRNPGRGSSAGDRGGGRSGKLGNVSGDIGGLQADMLTFLKEIAGQLGRGISVNSGARPNDTGSAHQGGNASDLNVGGGDARSNPSTNANGIAIAKAALIVMGVSPRRAQGLAQGTEVLNFSTNYRWKGRSVEIGWRTMVGGNHYNHVHVGFDS